MFTLSISIILDFISSLLLSLFLDTINPFRGKKKTCYFSTENFLGIFGARLIFVMEAVTSSKEVSEGSIVHNEGSAQTDNTH
jgi:hypothetical protein